MKVINIVKQQMSEELSNPVDRAANVTRNLDVYENLYND